MCKFINDLKNKYIIRTCVVILGYAIVMDIYVANNCLPCWIPVIVLEDSFLCSELTMFATLSSASIALVAFITCKTDVYIYGVSISEYMVHLKNSCLCPMNIMIVLLTVNVLSVLCYFKDWCNLQNALYIILILLLIRMLCSVSIVFNSRETLEAEIKQYVLANYKKNKGLLVNLLNANRCNVGKSNLNDINMNVDLALEIWKELLHDGDGK